MRDDLLVISAEDLEAVESRLYGFMVADDGELVRDRVPERASEVGCYVLVERDAGSITVRQDFYGSFGLYLWRSSDGSRFMLSNSFFALADRLRGKLSLNRECALALASARDVPGTYSATLANEIERLDSSCVVRISLADGRLSLEQTPRTYFARRLGQPGSFELLDAWYFKWVGILRRLVADGYPIVCDLSGGIDTRIILAMLRSGNVDVPASMRIRTHTKGKLPKDAEDLRVAGLVADACGLTLNGEDVVALERHEDVPAHLTFEQVRRWQLSSSLQVKFTHKESDIPLVRLRGFGSRIKGTFRSSPGEFRGLWMRYARDFGLSEADQRALIEYYRAQSDAALRGYAGPPSHEATLLDKKVYMEGRDTRKAVALLEGNQFVVSPFVDPLLFELDYNPPLTSNLFLACVILDRYAPDLRDIELQGRVLPERDLKLAQAMNRAHPLQPREFEPISGRPSHVTLHTSSDAEMAEMLEEVWQTPEFLERVGNVVGLEQARRVIAGMDKERLSVGFQPIDGLLAINEFLRLI